MDFALVPVSHHGQHRDAQRFQKEYDACKTERDVYQLFFGTNQWFNHPALSNPFKGVAQNLYDRVHLPLMMKRIALTYDLLSEKLPEEDLLRLGGSRPQISNEEIDVSEMDADYRGYMTSFGSIEIRQKLGLPLL